jgi:folate-binding protein YgfZ
VTSLAVRHWQFSAWLDPQGRVRALFHLARIADDRLLLLLRGGHASAMTDALRRYVFRSRVSLTALPPRALATGSASLLHELRTDGEAFSFGCGAHALEITTEGSGDNAWRLPQMHMGWPWLPESRLNELLPPTLSLQRLHAAVIDKGCYPGQEIVARLHYRGGSKRHLHGVELSQPASAGEALQIDGREVGCLLDVLRQEDRIDALAVLHDEVVSQARGGRLDVFDAQAGIRLCTAWPP